LGVADLEKIWGGKEEGSRVFREKPEVAPDDAQSSNGKLSFSRKKERNVGGGILFFRKGPVTWGKGGGDLFQTNKQVKTGQESA